MGRPLYSTVEPQFNVTVHSCIAGWREYIGLTVHSCLAIVYILHHGLIMLSWLDGNI